ncbi:MAG: beta-glucosidase [Ruminococcus sp.]|nr:beta-glucosidase [Ruminococcus sp.]
MYNYLNENLPVRDRVQNLLHQLTLEEKIYFLSTHQLPIERLHIPEWFVGHEIARGLVNREPEKPSTVFPQPIGMASSFDKDMMYQIGLTAGREARAYYNQGDKKGGLMVWGPTVDLSRDPRWGRTEECYGEDPFLTGEMSAMYTKGLKGDDPKIWATIPTLKHFCANNHEQERAFENANLNPRLKHEHYYQAFKKPVVKGGAHSVMTAYNDICHAPAVVNHDLKNILKKEWKLGFIVTDGGDFTQNVTAHHAFASHAESLQACLYAGADCMTDNTDCVIASAQKALENGLLSESDIDTAVGNILESHFLLGRFDKSTPYDKFTLEDVNTESDKALNLRAAREGMVLLDNHKNILPLNPEKHHKIGLFGQNADCNLMDWYTGTASYNISIKQALEEKGFEVIYDPCWEIIKIIASNQKYVRIDENDCLIADSDQEHAAEFYLCQHDDEDKWNNLQEVKSKRFVCIDGNTVKLGKTEVYGWFTSETLRLKWHQRTRKYIICDYLHRNIFGLNEKNQLICQHETRPGEKNLFTLWTCSAAVGRLWQLTKDCDAVIYCGGNDPEQVARECWDRKTIDLPTVQGTAVQDLKDAVKYRDIPLILVLVSSYPYAMCWEWDDSEDEHIDYRPDAILWTSHAGSELGHAVAETLFGENNPAGRCPVTWYAGDEDLPGIKDYDIMKTKMTYRYFDGTPLYPFGYGLSYSHFAYDNLKIKTLENGIQVNCQIKNTSDTDGDEVVQVYAHAKSTRIQRPEVQLCAFARMHIKAGETAEFSEIIPFEEFEIYDVSRERFCLEDGDFDILVGASCTDIKLAETIHISGEIIPPRNLEKLTRAELYDTHDGTEIFTNPLSGVTHVRGMKWHNEIIFQNCDFTDCKALTVLASAPIDPTAIQVYLDDSNTPLTEIEIPVSDGYEDFKTCTIKFEPDGCHDLKFVFSQGTCIKALQIQKS